jgi:hypothetical protein
VDLSGIIFVVLAVAWAVYLIPKAVRHHDEVARTRSIDRFSTAMRVLARREPVGDRDARLVVAPARAADNPRVLVPGAPAAAEAEPVRTASRPAARRAAARRRRRILSFLLLADLVVTGLAAFAVVSWWSIGVPAGLTVLYLVLCRTQVRRAEVSGWDRELATSADELPAHETAAAARRVQGFEEVDADEDTIAIPASVLDAVAVPTVDGGSLWDPLPVTLPTYVTKPKARRTVRTIDLNEPNTWTSGRTEEDAKLVAESAAGEVETADEVAPQQAVGS